MFFYCKLNGGLISPVQGDDVTGGPRDGLHDDESDDLDDEVEHWRKLEHIRSMTVTIETKRQAR